jgi:hypothetical protein
MTRRIDMLAIAVHMPRRDIVGGTLSLNICIVLMGLGRRSDEAVREGSSVVKMKLFDEKAGYNGQQVI